MRSASGRTVFMLVAGLLMICIGTPSQAASSGTEESAPSDRASRPTEVKNNADHKRHSADRQSGKSAEKSSLSTARNVTPALGAMPPSVANAKALIIFDRTPQAAAAAMAAHANDIVHAAAEIPPEARPTGDTQVIPSDQLNDIDRASQESGQATATPAASAPPMQQPPEPMTAAARSESSTESSGWDQTSLIGKIFVGIGTLLTLASAARMFVA